MATTATNKTQVETIKFGGLEGVAVMQGMDLVDKSTLVDIPFVVTGVKATSDKKDREVIIVEAVLADGSYVTFQDYSGTGVKFEAEELLKKYHSWKGELSDEKWYDFKMLCPKGLRDSHHTQQVNGKATPAITYYFTKAGNKDGQRRS